jgi:cell division protease FtsH
MLALVAQWWFDTVAGPEQVALSDFVETMEAGDFEAIQILERSNEVQARVQDSQAPEGAWDQFAPYPDGFEGELTATAIATGTLVSSDSQPPGFFDYLISFLPWLFLLGFMVFIFMQMQGGGNRVMQFGKSKAKLVGKEQPKVTFDDVAGLEEAKEELE